MDRAIIVINRYPPSPQDVSKALDPLPPHWRLIRTMEDVDHGHTHLVIEATEIPAVPDAVAMERYPSAATLLKAVQRG